MKGFTLIELIFTVAFIGLAVWGVSSFVSFLSNAKEAKHQQFLESKQACESIGGAYILTSNFTAQCYQRKD